MKSVQKSINTFLSSTTKFYKGMSNWAKVLFYIIILLILVSLFNNSGSYSSQEGFIQKETFVQKTGNNVYDEFYADIYDYLVYSDVKNEYEIGQIVNKTTPTTTSIILDVGSGTGHHVGELNKQNLEVVGVDISSAMVNKAKENYPKATFKQGNALDKSLFQPNSFTHIMCMYFTIYYMENKSEFFKNCYYWLKPGGYLIIHLVNKDLFDPILPPGNPLIMVSPQRYAKKRITTTKVKFTDFSYDSDFQMENGSNKAIFVEKFKNNKNNQTRKNEHVLYMDSQESILMQAQETGFLLEAQADLIKSQYEYQYLYFLIKPS